MLSVRTLLLVGCLLAGCGIDAPPSSGCTPETPCGDDIVAGVNLTALLAPPLGGERTAVRARWATRTAAATGAAAPAVSVVAEAPDATGATVRVLAGRDRTSGDTVFVAAVRLPFRAAGDQRRRPVVLFLPDAPGTLAADNLPSQAALDVSLHNEVAMVGLAYRGASLTVGSQTFASSGTAVPYITDVEDALTVLATLSTLLPSSEPVDTEASKVGAVGLGRGGTAALWLREQRRVAVAASVGAPTSWFVPSARAALRASLLGTAPPPLPDLASVVTEAVRPLQQNQIPLAEARLRLLDRSPAPFLAPRATDPPVVTIVAAHGRLDPIVPADHAGALLEVLGTSGAVLQPDEAGHDVRTREEVMAAVSSVVRDRLGITP